MNLIQSEYIPAQDIPDIGLYMDQVTTFMESKLDSSRRYPDDKIMTKTMINNYTKNHLIPPSVKKKYSRDHMFFIIIIYYLKTILSISDIKQLLTPLVERYFPENKENGIISVSMETLLRFTTGFRPTKNGRNFADSFRDTTRKTARHTCGCISVWN